jgi:hypothetical protein
LSYIDTFDHEFVGYFGGIPVYHPLVDIPDGPDRREDFGCGPGHLVIGGGSGEHPAIVVLEPSVVVISFIHAWREELERLYPDEYQSLRPTAETLPAAPVRWHPDDWWGVLDFAGWAVKDYVKFDDRCKSRAFRRPFDPDKDGLLEAWLASSVGEFILLAMPELCRDLTDQLADLRDRVGCFPLYENILLVPPGYRVWGRRERNNQVMWGNSAWRVERVPGT